MSANYRKIVKTLQPDQSGWWEQVFHRADVYPLFAYPQNLDEVNLERLSGISGIPASEIKWSAVTHSHALIASDRALRVIPDGGRAKTYDWTKVTLRGASETATIWGYPLLRLEVCTGEEKFEVCEIDFRIDKDSVFQTVVQELGKPRRTNAIVFGATGVGKSTLINAIVGHEVAKADQGAAQTQDPSTYSNWDKRIAITDMPGWESNEGVDDAITRLEEEIEDLRDNSHGFTPDVMWYCMRAKQGRFDEASDGQVIERIQRLGIPVIIVLTKSSNESQTDFREYLNDLHTVHAIIPVNSLETRTASQFGLNELIEQSRIVAGLN